MESMADEDFKLFTMGKTELKVFRDGRIQHLDKRSKSKVWKDKKANDCEGYLKTDINGKKVFVHTIIALCYLGIKPEGKQIDHINSIRNDNRVENLQYISQSENNLKKTTKNGKPIKGTQKTPSGRFQVRLYINKKRTCLGTYDTEEKAIEIYIQAKAKLLINIELE